jgi:hypothetical protein
LIRIKIINLENKFKNKKKIIFFPLSVLQFVTIAFDVDADGVDNS